ncbi:MAG: Dabb family protein [Tepidisphaeraceae bacterium]|jgi:hypothetical protein
MKYFISLLIVLSAGFFSWMAFAQNAQSKKEIYHVVCFKFKAGTTPEQIKQVEDAFAALKIRIPTVTSLKWGTNISPEKKDKGFTHCFILTFASEKDRDDYLPHPEHKAFGKIVGPVLDDVFVFDYVARE